ncbi:MAG: hypothetical protein IID39_07370 [Planctomycetes bacterium]|nr:hypothetical protein [Planctomycetota bacterium]
MKNDVGWMVWAAVAVVATMPGAASGQYHRYDELQAALETLVAAHPDQAELTEFGKSRQGRSLWALTLAAQGAKPPGARTALLVVAGIDGDHLVGSEVALRVAQKLLADHAEGVEAATKLLTSHTVYVLPRVNPDAQEMFFAPARWEWPHAMRPVDDDRDGVADEDGPEDLNGDGLITQMRVPDPEATHIADPKEPRLVREADRAKGETPVYKMYVEGIDNDGDEEINEDPIGGVDLNANFLHRYPAHEAHAGPYQLSEPESRALIDFVLEHPRIAMTVTYGRHNNLLDVKGGGKKDDTGKAPVGLLDDDVDLYKQISERFKELTEMKKGPSPEAAGAFFAWAYAQYGVPSFATSVWTRPEPEKEDKENGEDDKAKEEDKPDDEDGVKDAEENEDESRGDERPRRRRPGRGRAGKDKDAKKKDAGKEFEEDLKWLKYSDASRDGGGFVDWTPFEHPTLGKVEIGGFVPYFKTNPPPEELEQLAEAQAAFLLDLGGRFCELALDNIEVSEHSPTVFEIKAMLINRGYFPSALAVAKENRRVRPVVVTLDVGLDAVLGGGKVHKVWSVPGSGGVYKLRWIVRGRRGEAVTIKVTSEKYGDFSHEVTLATTPTVDEGGAE